MRGALLASTEVLVDVVLVDNGCTSDAVRRLSDVERVRVVQPGSNTGFAGGCNLGARLASGDVVAFVNSDAVVRPTARRALAGALRAGDVGIASGSLRLRDRPEVINSAGNPVHYLGLSWAGGLGEPATDHARPRSVASACGGLMALRRETWEALGGFYEPMFAYCEDVELSLRCWQRGWSVRYVPEAVATHDYQFSRNSQKLYLLERNRLLVLLTLYEGRTLLLLLGPLLGLEVAVLAVAAAQGWAGQKTRGWWWLLRHHREVRRRRRHVQTVRAVPDAGIVPLLADRFAPGAESGFAVPPAATVASVWYWRAVRRSFGQVSVGSPESSLR
ncbi:MAG: glycosyltransferase family 2 protein [Nocardioidaceae bacterium]